ncbi:MAG TPA: site-specific DNA-methyltransferase [Thermoanaerobaculia bacterium]|jgi:adenine-specific DNA-methyltransferase|nr:site-specific DNA-methyltransferase [Thermoanaerobaculia bacterium]
MDSEECERRRQAIVKAAPLRERDLRQASLFLLAFALMAKGLGGRRRSSKKEAEPYRHPTAEAVLRPEIGTQPQFKKKKPPQTYRYDSSLSPALEWDGGNAARERGEALIRQILEAPDLETAQKAAAELVRLSRPFLQWAGKGERLSFEVPTLPLFIHERLSTQAILETLRGRQPGHQLSMWDLYGDREHPVYEQILSAYEHKNGWVNRMILGDSLVVMNSLLHYEGLGGQVQMIYMDPPYGVKFGSNFQPFVRKRDVKHNDDADMTREPEMVKAYRDTWELGLHSYLTYLRDRLLIARDLLTPRGSVFVQISDENLHHVREVMDEVFGSENYVGQIAFRKTGSQSTKLLSSTYDFVLQYARDIQRIHFQPLWLQKDPGEEGAKQYLWLEAPDGSSYQKMTDAQIGGYEPIPRGWRVFRPGPLTSPGASSSQRQEISLQGRTFTPGPNRHWSLGPEATEELDRRGRTLILGNTPCSKLYLEDFPVSPLKNVWTDTGGSGFAEKPLYVVQTDPLVIQRCILMTTLPGDLVIDPTCGSGTTAHVAEQWGRRWITMDTSRVPLALARQRLLTATYDFYELKDAASGPAGGFVYRRYQNSKGEEIGGIVPHVTLKSIASDEPPAEEILVDRPEVQSGITRVTGPFCVEATIPAPAGWDEDEDGAEPVDAYGAFRDRMLEVLRRSPVLHVGGGKVVTFTNVRPPARTLSLAAEAMVEQEGEKQAVAFAFGPENGAVSETLVFQAAKEAAVKRYKHLYVIGFAIQPHARGLIEHAAEAMDIPATYIQATPDLLMGDLLKTLRSSQIFSVCGLPDVELRKVAPISGSTTPRFEVELKGLDVFDPVTMETDSEPGSNVPAWLLDSDYNGLCFRASQVFFPRTAAWDALKRSLKGEFDDSVWEHLAGAVSAPFEEGTHGRIAVKVIDDRGNELMVVKDLAEAV